MTLFELTSVYDLTGECYRFSQRMRMRCTCPDATAVTSRLIKSHASAAENGIRPIDACRQKIVSSFTPWINNSGLLDFCFTVTAPE